MVERFQAPLPLSRGTITCPVCLSLFLSGGRNARERERERLPSYSSLPLQGRLASMSSGLASSVAFPPAVLPPGRLTSRKARGSKTQTTAKLWQHLNMNQCARTPA